MTNANTKLCDIGPMVTVIIPTFNAGESFAQGLEALKMQTVKPHQILIVDSQSNDGTVELAKRHNCQVTIIKQSDFGHGKTRNLAVSRSQTQFFVFLTQDAVPADENMIAKLIKPMLSNPMIAICYGRQLPNVNARPLESLARQFNYPADSVLKTIDQIDEMGVKTFFCSNSCSAIRRSIFKELGGFDDNAITNEDMLFGAKAVLQGYSIYYAAEAKAYHSHNHSLTEVFSRNFKIGRFFAENKSTLPQTAVRGYGLKMLNFGIHSFWQKRYLPGIIALFIELATKTIAYRFGYFYQLYLRKKDRL